jgi:sortase system peptidoglycan-associated protein
VETQKYLFKLLEKTMKKSLLNITVTMALSSAVFSGSVLSTQAYADGLASTNLVADDIATADNNNSNDITSEDYMYPGMGVGAATGTLIAGPIGLVVGGIIGAIVGSSQEVTQDSEETSQHNSAVNASHKNKKNENIELTAYSENPEKSDTDNSIHVAQLGPINNVVEDQINPQQEQLMNILVTDLSLDVYFRSGSTDIEEFYPARLAAIADLVNTMDKLELHLDGYTDRRGNKSQNIALANKRIDKVREQLIQAGVEENRIVSKAFGEAKMKSSAGNLDAYTFDRRVVIRFERATNAADNSMAAAFSMTNNEDTVVSVTDKNSDEQTIKSISHVAADASPRF